MKAHGGKLATDFLAELGNIAAVQQLANLLPVGVYACDAAGLIIFYNKAVTKIWGRRPALGDHYERFCGSYKMYRPDGAFLPHSKSVMAETLRLKKPVIDREIIMERPRGGPVTVVANTAPIVNNGKFVGAVNCLVDITERKRIARELEESEQRFRQLSEAATEGIIIHEGGRILDCNSGCERMYGYSRADLIGSNGLNLVAPKSHKIVKERIENGIENEYEYSGLRKDGTKFPVKAIAKNCLFRGKRARVVVLRDLSERREIERALRQFPIDIVEAQEQERRRVARDLHDGVTQLLSSVRFRIQLIAASVKDRPSKAVQESSRAEKLLVEALEEVRRISKNLRPSELDDLGFAPAVRSLLREFTVRTGVKVKISLEQHVFPKHMKLTMYRILQEALNNVEKHANATKVTVKLGIKNGIAHFRISDNGKGFSTRTNGGRKGGFGFESMKERAAYFDGDTAIYSQPRRGTTVDVRVPIMESVVRKRG